jgi:hypothetical protein
MSKSTGRQDEIAIAEKFFFSDSNCAWGPVKYDLAPSVEELMV